MYKDGGRINSSAISLLLTAYNISHVTISVNVWAILSEVESKSVKIFNSWDITSNKTSLETRAIYFNMQTHRDY